MSHTISAPNNVQVAPTRLRHTAEKLIGRADDLKRLDAAWDNPQTNVVVVRAFGGMGKTSLVAAWMAELAAHPTKPWRGVVRVFDWSFYSQGTGEHRQASSDVFIDNALRWFGDPDPVAGSPWDRGARLAALVGQARALLVLDGLEPLQHPPGPLAGKLRDQGIEALLKGLAAHNAGLCVVTTRERVEDLQSHYGRTAEDFELPGLSDLAGASLLHHNGARKAGAREIPPDDRELQTASREMRGHGLTLQLVGQYLRLVEQGDILKRDTIRLADAEREYQNDATRPYGHAFKAMEAYERWLEAKDEGGRMRADGPRMLAALRLLGLFDRPASADCLAALRAEPAIPGLTEPLVNVTEREWRLTLTRLADINLLTVQADGGVDAHPLLREYFATQLRQRNAAGFRAAHRRLYEHLCQTPDKPQPTLDELQPLYQAVAHGCLAGLQQEACDEVYFARIGRRAEFYATNKLGAFGSDLGAVACFFEQPWSRVSEALTEADQAWLLNQAAFGLRAVGRLTESLEPMRASGDMDVKVEKWKGAAISYSNLSELELTLGEVSAAVEDAAQSVRYADRSGVAFQQMINRTTHADALRQSGRRAEAEALFREAEQMQAARQPDYPLLYSLPGFQYCDLLLAPSERAAARVRSAECGVRNEELIESCRAVTNRSQTALNIVLNGSRNLLDIALNHLTLGRAALYEAFLTQSALHTPHSALEQAVSGLRSAGQQDELPKALLTRAWLRALTGRRTGAASAVADLDEAWDIAARGSMRLFQADILLMRARLFGLSSAEEKYPWESPQADLAAARALIEQCGYGRRLEELEDAELALRDAHSP